MKKQGLLAASIAVALVGCGSDNESSAPTTFTITAIDGYLANANVSVDSTQDGVCNLSQGKTDNKGQANLSVEYRNSTVCVDAVAGQTIDSNRGLVQHDFTLANAGSGTIINPMTNMVQKLLAADTELTLAEAEEQVVAAITGDAGLEVSQALIFGDYIADTSEQAEALNLIGEVLVDKSDQDIDTKLKLAQAMAEATQEIIETGESLDGYSPIIDIPPSGGDIIIIPNTRPKVVGTTDPVELMLGDAWLPYDVSDKFQDTDDMTFTMAVAEFDGDDNFEGNNGLSIDAQTGMITGVPEKAGSFVYHIFATDTHDARSYPLTFEVTVLTENKPPVLDEGELANLQSTMNAWVMTEGETLDDTLDVSALFTDSDGDDLDYKVETTLSTVTRTGFNALVSDDGIVSFTGLIPRSAAADTETVTVSVNDGVNSDWVSATLSFPIIEEAPLPPGDTHPLEENTWYFLERGSNGTNYAQVWCDTVRFENGEIFYNDRDQSNKSECTTEATMKVGTYVIEGDTLVGSYTEDDETMTMRYDITNDYDSNVISPGAVTMLWTEEGRSSRYVGFSSQEDAEKRIQVKSSDGPELRDAYLYWPSEQAHQYQLISTSLQMNTAEPSSDNSHDYIKVWMNGISCDGLFDSHDGDTAIFERFTVTSETISASNGNSLHPQFCDDVFEGDTPNAVLSFLFGLGNSYSLELDETYSIIGQISDDWSEYITDVNFNMVWDGSSNDD
ncbi:putative Ig domain-containing protein [Vibrio pelagius]|uniref:Ig domain-containing protein n=1 Tax=Vibrio pelagius TaxID=28169 RepID=A0ABY5G2P6_VIBPE|nr:putative Ig domain-containing protein [Vibrio pelagius]UTT84256.1 putative Ig domain-containing protein [Vibrio pelagius]